MSLDQGVEELYFGPLFPIGASNRPLWTIGEGSKMALFIGKKKNPYWINHKFKIPTIISLISEFKCLIQLWLPSRLLRVINTSGAFWAIQLALRYKAWQVPTRCSKESLMAGGQGGAWTTEAYRSWNAWSKEAEDKVKGLSCWGGKKTT